MALFLEEQAANRAYREEMNSKIEALSMGGSGHADSHTFRFNKHQGQTSGSNSSGIAPRFAKLDFPKFSGSEDPLGWLSRCEHFFCHQQTPEDEKVSLASYHLDGNAQLWFIQLLADYPDPTWAEFQAQCHLRFGPPIRSNKLGELAKLQQTGTVSEYQNQFETLVSRAGTLSPRQKVELYMSGLNDYIAVEVELHHPRDLATAMSMSRLYERKLFAHIPSFRDSKTNDLDSRSTRQTRRLSNEEMEERRRKGLCFNCDEIFVWGHHCKRLFFLEVEEHIASAGNFLENSTEDLNHQLCA